MSALSGGLRFLGILFRHPVTQEILRHAIRTATAELVRQIQHRTRHRQGVPHVR